MILVDWLVGKKVTVSLRNEKINQQAIQKTLKEQATEITNRKLNLNNQQKASVIRQIFPENHLIPLMYEQGSVSDQMDTEVCNQLPKAIQAIWPTVDMPYGNFSEELAKVKIKIAALKAEAETKEMLLKDEEEEEAIQELVDQIEDIHYFTYFRAEYL